MNIPGITYSLDDNCSLFLIDHLSNEFKECIRRNLQNLFWGADEVACVGYTYQDTLKEFLVRYEAQDVNKKKGMIGELLINIIIMQYISHFETISVLTNLEERNIKKGFDIVYYHNQDGSIWYAEVKSGEKNACQSNSSDIQTKILYNRAYHDMKAKMTERRVSLWDSALRQAKLMITDSNDLTQVRQLLRIDRDEAARGMIVSKCVILATSLFSCLADPVSYTKIQELYATGISSGSFDKIYLVSIQKNTYAAIELFLKSEIL